MIDRSILINKENIPKLINDCLEKLEYYNEIENEEIYYSALELLETTAKSYVISNKLTEEDYHIILKKYGGEV